MLLNHPGEIFSHSRQIYVFNCFLTPFILLCFVSLSVLVLVWFALGFFNTLRRI